MGDRAVIKTKTEDIGIYIHWYGQLDCVLAFLTYCRIKDYRIPEFDNYGWARLCTVISNFCGDGLGVGIGPLTQLDCDNGDNGTYTISGWKIIDRDIGEWTEDRALNFVQLLTVINARMPEHDKMSEGLMIDWLRRHMPEVATPAGVIA